MAIHSEFRYPVKHPSFQSNSPPSISRLGKGFTQSPSERIEMIWNTFVQLWDGFDLKKQISAFFNPTEISDLDRAVTVHDKKGHQLKGNSTFNYLTFLMQSNTNKKVQLISTFYATGQHYGMAREKIKSSLEKEILNKNEIENKNFDFISIPIAIDGHITHLLIEGNNIEFFDPFGKAMDHPDNHVGSRSFWSKIKIAFGIEKPILIREIAEIVKEILLIKHSSSINNFLFHDHQTQVQFDVHNCGVFVQKHFKERIFNKFDLNAPQQFLNWQNSIEGTRKGMANFLRGQVKNSNSSRYENSQGDDF